MRDLIDLSGMKTRLRVPEMVRRICGAIVKNKPDIVVLEGVEMQSNPATLMLLARLQGGITGFCDINNIPYEIIMPAVWRKLLGFKQGKGVKRAQLKEQAIAYVRDKYHIAAQCDICESICIGDAYFNSLGEM